MMESGDCGNRALTILLRVTLGLLLITSLCILLQWFNFATGLLLLATVGAASFLVLETSMKVLRCSRDARNRFRLLLATILLLLMGVETVLRFGLHRNQTYPERNGWGYRSLFAEDGTPWFSILGTKQELTYSKEEFDYSRHVNSQGIREMEIKTPKAPNEYRILALGDSFTEGVGTTSDSTWVKVLEHHLAARMPERLVTTINGGISGSDPSFEYLLLRERLLKFEPDLVIVCVNPTDVSDVMLRGGLERFHPDGTIHYLRRAPKWEWLYASSYIFRSVIHDLLGYNWFFIKESRVASTETAALESLRSTLIAYRKLSDEHGFRLLVVFHPASPWEVIDEKYPYHLDRLISALRQKDDMRVTDLLEYYSRHHSMSEPEVKDFFWPLDGHLKTKGYEIMGEAIAEAVAGMVSLPPALDTGRPGSSTASGATW